jgi:thioredoxin-like negative regulator of GroEL
MFTPELDWIVENNQDVFQDKVSFLKVDVTEEKNKSAVDTYGISCVPHVVLFKGGKPIVSSLGFMAREVLVRFIRDNL